MKVFAVSKNGERLSELGFFFDYGHARLALQAYVQHGNSDSKYPDSFGIEKVDLPALNPSHKNAIDWEQRRWNMASGIFLNYSDLTNKTCIEMADSFIEGYKQSLNTEE